MDPTPNDSSPTPAAPPKPPKDQSIETLRGVAIILMVMGHVIGDKPTNGIRVADDSEFRHLYYSLSFFRLPLFTVMSGFVYSLRPVAAGRSLTFMRGKGRRILLPMAAVGTLEFLMRWVVPGTNTQVELSQIWKIYVLPFDHFWFLQSIFLVFLTVTVLEGLELLKTPLRWAIALTVATVIEWRLSLLGLEKNPFSYLGYLYLLPYFILGVGIGRFRKLMRSPWVIAPAAVALTWGLIGQQAHWYGWDYPLLDRVNPTFRGGGFGMLIGLTGCTILFRLRWTTAWLGWLGYYAYGIYLFHVFGTAGSRIVATKLLGLESKAPLFVLSLGAGLCVPIVIEWVIERSNTLRLVFLGLRPRKPEKS